MNLQSPPPSNRAWQKLANKLLVKPGDQITIFSLKDDRLPSQENLPTIKRFKVIGLFESGMSEFDDLLLM